MLDSGPARTMPLDLSDETVESMAWLERTVAPMACASDLLAVGVVIGDRFGGARWANRAWQAMTGQTATEATGAGWLKVLDPEAGEETGGLVRGALAAGQEHGLEWSVRRRSGELRRLRVTVAPAKAENGVVLGFVATVIDVTEEWARAEDLVHRATHDALTGLHNRGAFDEFVAHALDRRNGRPNRLAAVIYADLNGLKATNDRLGHAAGDRLLVMAADQLRHAVRPGDVVARYGGDEFTVLCEDLDHPDEALSIARRIVRAPGAATGVSLSVGVAVTDDSPRSAARLIREADDAMYLAKELRVAEPIVTDFRLSHAPVIRVI